MYRYKEERDKLFHYNFNILYIQKEFRLKIFYFEFKRLSSRYIFQVNSSLQSSGGGIVVEKEFFNILNIGVEEERGEIRNGKK